MKFKFILLVFVVLTVTEYTISGHHQPSVGPSERLLAENKTLQEKIAVLKQYGVILEACIACSNMYGVTDEFKVYQVDVKGML